MILKVKIHLLQTSIHFNSLEIQKKLTTLFPKDAAHDSINQSISLPSAKCRNFSAAPLQSFSLPLPS